MEGRDRCMGDRYPKVGIYRGLCARHYQRLQKAVLAGKASWDKLEVAGKCKPQVRGRDGKLFSGVIRGTDILCYRRAL